MLTLDIGAKEGFDEKTNEFVTIPGTKINFEHSLVSLYKWESKWEKPFLGNEVKTNEQTLDYIKAMAIDPISDEVFAQLTDQNIEEVNKYIEAKMTATWFKDSNESPKSREVITAEIVYYWLIALSIPFECQHWHLNQLLTLIRVCNEKNQTQKKMDPKEAAAQKRMLNAERKARLQTSG